MSSKAGLGALQCHNLDEFVSLQKKLAHSWSSWSGSRLLSPTLLDDLSINFDALEKKVQMRVLISLIGLDLKRRQEYTKQIKHLLKVAQEACEVSSSDGWVAVIAGLVSERLFGDDTLLNSNSVSQGAKDSLNEAVDTLLQRIFSRVPSAAADDDDISNSISADAGLESVLSFPPLEHCYTATAAEVAQEQAEFTRSKSRHFVFSGTAPNVLERDLERQAKNIRSLPTNVNIGAAGKVPEARSEAPKALTIGFVPDKKPSFLMAAQRTSKVPALVMSLDDLKAIGPGVRAITAGEKQKKVEKLEKEPKVKEAKEKKPKPREKKEKIPAAAGESGSAEAAAAAAAEGKEPTEDSEKIEALEDAVEAAAAQAIGMGSTTSPGPPPQDTLLLGKRKREEGNDNGDDNGGGNGNAPASGSSTEEYNLPQDLAAMKAAATHLSSADSVLLDRFFTADWASAADQLHTALPEQRVLLRELEATDRESGKVVGKSSTYLVLVFATHTWNWQTKYRAKKSQSQSLAPK